MGICSLPQPGLRALLPSFGSGGIALVVSLANRLYAPTVSGVCSNQKPFVMVTWWAGFSSLKHSLSSVEQPISKVAGGIHAYFKPSQDLTVTVSREGFAVLSERLDKYQIPGPSTAAAAATQSESLREMPGA